jgi:PAS domain S-box-containing protein
MEKEFEYPAEIWRLQRCINDLVGVLALPAVWSGAEPHQILSTLLEALLSMLGLKFIYARVQDPVHGAPVEAFRGSPDLQEPQLREIRDALSQWFGADPQSWPPPMRNRWGDQELSTFPIRLGWQGEIGLIAAGSERSDFPEQTERLVLSVAANQAAVGLQQAQLLNEQRRVAGELDRRVAQRTEELAAANQELARSEERWRSVFENSAVGVALTDLEGRFIATNPVYQQMLGYTEEELRSLTFLDITREEYVETNRELIGELIAGTRRQFQLEKQYRRKNGAPMWVRNNVSLVPGTERVPRFIMAIVEDISDRKHAEDALRASERDLAAIINTIPTTAWSTRPDGYRDFLNQRWLEYTGMTAEQAQGWGWGAAIHPDDRQALLSRWRICLTTGSPLDTEIRMRRYDGAYRWFLLRANPLHDASGAVVRWYGTNIDIEDRKRLEESLRASELSWRQIVDSIPGFVVTTAPMGDIEFLNRQTLEYFGKTADELKNWALIGAVHPDDLPRVAEVRTKSIETGTSYDIEHRCRRADGTYRWFQVRGLPVRDAAGSLTTWYLLLTDIDDRKRAEEQLRRSEAFLAEGQRLGRLGTFSWRLATDEIIWSDQLYRIFEFEPGVLVTIDLIASRVHPDDLALMQDMVEKARSAASDFEYEHRLLMPDLSVKYLHLVGHAMRDPQGGLEYVGAVQDVTQRRLSEEALAEVRAELAHVARISSLGALTASIAHEVNQPLSGIVTNSNTCLRMLSADPPNVEGARETARRTIRDGNRASEVIARLRTLYSKRDPSPEVMDLNEAAREVIALFLTDLQRNRIILRHELAEDLPWVFGDRVQLQQVILNLLRNASEAMNAVDDRPRELLVRTERERGDQVRLSVKDAGVGFDPRTADRLFEAFYSTKSEGMGVGLAVSRSIIEAHRGRLWATRNDGPGSTFAFSIPRDLSGSLRIGSPAVMGSS